MDIFDTIKNDNLIEFKKAYSQDPQILELISSKKLNTLSYSVAAEAKEIFKFILEKIDTQTINKGNYNPLSLALEYQDFDMASQLINSGKILKNENQNILGDVYTFDAPEEIKSSLYKSGFSWNDNVLGDNCLNNLFQEKKHQRKILEISEDELKKSVNKNTFEIILSRKDNDPEIINKIFNFFNEIYNETERDIFFGRACEEKNYPIIKKIFDLPGFYAGNKETIKMIDALIVTPKELEKLRQESLAETANHFEQASYDLMDVFKYNLPTEKYSKEKKQSILTTCLVNNNLKLFKHFIQTPNIDLEYTDTDGETTLVVACQKNQVEYVKILLENGASVNALSANGDNPLMISINNGNKEIFDLVNEKMGGYKEHKNDNGKTALNLAILSKDLYMVSQLLWGGADITSNPVVIKTGGEQINLDPNSDNDSYELDIQQKVFNTFKNLRLFGLNTDQTNENGDTFAHHFVKKGLVNNLNALFSLNINTNITDDDGNNLIMNAAKNSNKKIFESVLQNLSITQAFFQTDFTLKNSKDEDVYDLAMNCKKIPGESNTYKIENLLNLHLTQDASKEEMSKVFNKILPIISYAGDLKNIESNFIKYAKSNNITTLDKLGNSLISATIFGNKLENFDILTKNFSAQLFIPNNNGDTPIDFLKKINDVNPEQYEAFKEILTKNVEPQILDFVIKTCESPKMQINIPNLQNIESQTSIKTKKITP